MKNILTFDTEEWYHANYEGFKRPKDYKDSNFKQNMYKLLELCNKHNCKATFFTLGCIGEDHADIVRLVAKEGHDIASHGYSHGLAYNQTENEFKEDVKKSIGILEDITGKKVYGYRAPSWSIVEKNLHYLKVLQDLGLRYDASIFPIKTFLYGIPSAKREIHRPFVDGKELELYEIPTSVFNFFGKGFGYSGGFYFRAIPYLMIKRFIKNSNANKLPSIVYLHPREIDPGERRIELPFKERLIHYYNIGNTFKKLENTLKSFEFISIKMYLENEMNVDLEVK